MHLSCYIVPLAVVASVVVARPLKDHLRMNSEARNKTDVGPEQTYNDFQAKYNKFILLPFAPYETEEKINATQIPLNFNTHLYNTATNEKWQRTRRQQRRTHTHTQFDMELAKSMDFRTNKWVLQCAYKQWPDICVYLYIAVAGINGARSQRDRDNLWAARGKPSTTMSSITYMFAHACEGNDWHST